MNLGTALVTLALIVIVALIIRSFVKDKRAGKNVGCGACKSCAHSTSSFKSSHTSAKASCPSCANVDRLIADMNKASKNVQESTIGTTANDGSSKESSAIEPPSSSLR